MRRVIIALILPHFITIFPYSIPGSAISMFFNNNTSLIRFRSVLKQEEFTMKLVNKLLLVSLLSTQPTVSADDI